jgi:hypothetical protein
MVTVTRGVRRDFFIEVEKVEENRSRKGEPGAFIEQLA